MIKTVYLIKMETALVVCFQGPTIFAQIQVAIDIVNVYFPEFYIIVAGEKKMKACCDSINH